MEINAAVTPHLTGRSASLAGEYLTFCLGAEHYGLEILKVQEIRGYESVTEMVNTPDFIKGVINLRGEIVPIVDLRIKFKLKQVVYDHFTVVIILNLSGHDVGIVVDSVSEVIALKEEQVREVPSLVTTIDSRHLVGLAAIEDRMTILVDVEKLMDKEEMFQIDSALLN